MAGPSRPQLGQRLSSSDVATDREARASMDGLRFGAWGGVSLRPAPRRAPWRGRVEWGAAVVGFPACAARELGAAGGSADRDRDERGRRATNGPGPGGARPRRARRQRGHGRRERSQRPTPVPLDGTPHGRCDPRSAEQPREDPRGGRVGLRHRGLRRGRHAPDRERRGARQVVALPPLPDQARALRRGARTCLRAPGGRARRGGPARRGRRDRARSLDRGRRGYPRGGRALGAAAAAIAGRGGAVALARAGRRRARAAAFRGPRGPRTSGWESASSRTSPS